MTDTPLIGLYKCNESECSIETTGKCVNGLDPLDCPNKIPIIKSQIVAGEEQPIENQRSPTVNLKWGLSFNEDNISLITYRKPCKLILLIGEPSSGKSTLYAALFDSFHKGGCGEYMFSSTKTPIGFEIICHYAREKSKGKFPKTERTKSHEFAYLHLAVRHKNLKGEIKHLIFADVSGERFQNAKDMDEETLKLTVLKRADQIFFVADGGLLIKDRQKHLVKDDISKMITRCIQNKMFSDNQSINLIVTKWDEVTTAGKTSEVISFFIDPIKQRYAALFKNVIKIASRSMSDDIPPRTGIADFLEICLSSAENELPKNSFVPITNRQFQKFKYEIGNE